jgi:hypothetical protein
MGPQHLRKMERWNWLFTGVAILVAALAFDLPVVIGVGVGGLVASVNFMAIRKIWESLLSGSTEKRQAMQMLFLLKTVALIAVVFVCIRFLPLSPAAFAVGISIFLLSIAVESARYACGGHAVPGSKAKP